ncbi:MAG: hypothetical protein LC687_04235 [Actinobacteria bacterium]|nr:hypothetical protein [Actinomycetota bacterium]
MPKVPTKGEFETTDEYDQRSNAAVSSVAASPLIIPVAVPEKERNGVFVYDADRQVMRVKNYAFSAGICPGLGCLGHDRRGIEAVVSETEKVTGSYVGTNAFGVKAKVVQSLRTLEVLYEPKDAPKGLDSVSRIGWELDHDDAVFPKPAGVVGYWYPVVEFSIGTDDARKLKPNLRTVVVISPQEPFVVKGTKAPLAPTINLPSSTTVAYTLLVGDVLCGLVLDGSNKVVAAFPTN